MESAQSLAGSQSSVNGSCSFSHHHFCCPCLSSVPGFPSLVLIACPVTSLFPASHADPLLTSRFLTLGLVLSFEISVALRRAQKS